MNNNIENKIVYLNDACKIYKRSLDLSNSKKLWFKTPAGLKYNCKNCKKILYTEPYGSYEYCQSCYNNWNKNTDKKSDFKIDNDDVDFID